MAKEISVDSISVGQVIPNVENNSDKVVTSEISCKFKATIKIGDNFYSFTFAETRLVPEGFTGDLNIERKVLSDKAAEVVFDKAVEIYQTFGNN